MKKRPFRKKRRLGDLGLLLFGYVVTHCSQIRRFLSELRSLWNIKELIWVSI